MSIKTAIISYMLAGASITGGAVETMMWYMQPAGKWMEAMPLGNGRIGAMVYGGISRETVALNEISLWSGGPDSTSNDLCGKQALAEMRHAFFNNDPETGNRLGEKYLTGRMTTFGTHLPLGDLTMQFSYPEGQIGNYRRQLDLETATATVSFTCGDIAYTREYITSYPDNVMAIRCSASRPGAIAADIGLDLLRKADITATASGLELKGTVDFPMHGSGGVDFCGDIRLLPDNGTISASGNTVSICNADALTIIIDIRTDYNDPSFMSTCRSSVEAAAAKGWDTLKSNHIADYSALFSRMSIDLGASVNAGLPTDTRLHLTRQGVTDPGLDALFFQYGRYMLIASSRPNGTPLCANLQGVWNDNGACNMPWTCDYHLDINIPQNYWSANRANLAECNTPLFNYIRFLADNGRETARKVYGCNGWVAHTVCNAWGYTAPGWGVGWGMNVSGGAWIATHLWSHFLYTCDLDFLRETGYPLLKSTAEFFLDYMTEDPRSGYLVTGPSVSPENGYISPSGNHLSLDMMPTIDRCIVHDIYNACIEASKLLGVDKSFRQRLERDLERLPPLQIGADGQINEWLGDVRRSDPSHRHSSHLLSLFPLGQITCEGTPQLAAAAKKGLEIQTGSDNWEDTEWSTANMLCFYARLKEPSTAYGWLQNLFHVFTRDNLMTVSPSGVAGAEYDIFSFDATEASVAGICEMLVQSYGGCIDFLPALPAAWAKGSVKGICAEGGMVIDMDWDNGEMRSATILANADCTFRIKGREEKISLKKGEKRSITF